MKRALAWLCMLAAASACASRSPAPISYGGAGRAASPTPTEAAPEAPPRRHPTAPAPDWAEGPGTPLSAFALQPDEAQPFDPAHTPRTVRVGDNDQLYDIAARYQIPLRALIDENHLSPPYTLRPGGQLRLPPPRLHRVARGERFEDIARRYNVDPRSLALLNRMSPPYEVREGDAIVLPAMARAAPEEAPAAAIPEASATTAPPNAATTGGASAHFAWPLHGSIVARFGAQSGGRRLDGVEIAAHEGDDAAAAAEGEVVYAGADLPAYGTLVLVRHAGDYVTAYGFGARALVREGDHVRAGQAVLEVGRIGIGAPRLLFQIRQGSRPIDPLPLLGGG
jgi:murein DD-endopeptidase MepM/ murein hydrolase activator NlpD